MNKVSSLYSAIERSLEKHGATILNEQERINAEAFLRDAQSADEHALSLVNSKVNGDYAGCCTYIKISPIKIAPQYVFGSHVKADYINQISLCRAKYEDGEWKPDESQVIFKALITQQALTQAMFNTSAYMGEPITFTEFLGESLPQYKQQFSIGEKYQHRAKSDMEIAIDLMEKALAEAERLTNPDEKFNKTTKSRLGSLLGQLCRLAKVDLEFELELVREQMDKDFTEINAQTLATFSGHLQDIAEKLVLEYKEDGNDFNPMLSYFHTRQRRSRYPGVLKLLKKLEGELSFESNDARKTYTGYYNAHENPHVVERDMASQPTQGLMNISRPTGGNRFFFGDAREQQHYISLEFMFAADSIDEYGQLKLSDCSTFAKIDMTSMQLMELLQSGVTGLWTKCTLSRYMMKRVPTRRLETAKETDELHVDAGSKPVILEQLVNRLYDASVKLDTKSTSKAARLEVLEAVKSIAEILQEAIEAKDVGLQDTISEIFDKYKAKNEKKVADLLALAGEKHNIPPNLLSYLKV